MKYQKNYPYNEVKPFENLRDMLDKAADEAGDKIAFKYRIKGDEIAEITYKHFVRDVDAVGSALTEMGLIGEHIAQIGENSYTWINVYLSVILGDGVYVPIDKELPEDDILHILDHSDSAVLFFTSKYDDIVRRNANGKLSHFKKFIRIPEITSTEEKLDLLEWNLDDRFMSFRELYANGQSLLDDGYAEYYSKAGDRHAMKMIFYTSGTTGIAKGVMLSEHNVCSLVYYGLQVATIYETGLSVLPYHHTYEAIAGLLVGIHFHATICINDNLKNVMKNLLTFKPDYIYIVPAFAEEFYRRIWATAKKTGKEKGLKALIKMSNGMMKMGIDARRKLFQSILVNFGGNLKKIVCGGAPIRPEIGDFFDSIGILLTNGYGITECSPLVSVNRDYFNDPTTVGCLLPCVEVKIDDATPEGIGEICVKGDTVMLGYYNMPEVTAEVLSDDGWFKTGDYGMMNDKGQLLITGRKKNIIVLTNGKNIYPEEIENYIQNIPYIKEVVVFGLKNEYGEEYKLCAEVFPDADKVKELGIEDVAAALKKDISAATRHLPSYKNIGKIVIRNTEFEKTTTKKIKRSLINTDVE